MVDTQVGTSWAYSQLRKHRHTLTCWLYMKWSIFKYKWHECKQSHTLTHILYVEWLLCKQVLPKRIFQLYTQLQTPTSVLTVYEMEYSASWKQLLYLIPYSVISYIRKWTEKFLLVHFLYISDWIYWTLWILQLHIVPTKSVTEKINLSRGKVKLF